MTESYIEPADEDLDAAIAGFARLHGVKLLKAPLIAGMTAFAFWILSGSVQKALSVAAVCFVVSAFNTWRRFLEPLAFWLFVVAAIHWCNPDIFASLKSLGR